MPSRRTVALVLAFWLAVTGYVAYRDVWPVLFASGPPPAAVDLADEAARNVPVRWAVSLNGKKAGRLTTRTHYVEADDTFEFAHDYRQLRVEYGPLAVSVPELKTAVRVTRAGDLRAQTAEGRLELLLGESRVGDVAVKLVGTVAGGNLTAAFDGSYRFGGKTETVSRTLDPVPVPRGQPLNPMQPVNRVTGLRPGRRWPVHESNPLDDAIRAVAKEAGLPLPDERKGHLIGEVSADTQELVWNGRPVACQVIEYRRQGELEVRTWVRDPDGKVLKQEAFRKGETLTVERDE